MTQVENNQPPETPQSLPRVSVVMPVYNYGDLMSRAVNSLLDQSFTDWELIISDNASTDNTQEVATGFAAQDGRIHYFRNDSNVGVCGNFNLCEARTNPDSQYIFGLPADDWLHPQALAKLVAAADANIDVTITYCDGYRMDVDTNLGRYSDMFKKVAPAGKHRELGLLYRYNYIPFQGALVNRLLARQVYPQLPEQGLHDPELTYTSDYHMWLQLLSRGAWAYYIDEPLVYILKHERANTMPANIIARLHQEVRVFEKLEGVCPADLDVVRVRSLADRLARLSFLYVQEGERAQAKTYLRRATQASPKRRLDLTVATVISLLPLPAKPQAYLWRLLLSIRSRLKRSQV
jgi:hypothetical protein